MGEENCLNTLRWYIIFRQSWDGNRCVLEIAQRKELKNHSQNTHKKEGKQFCKKVSQRKLEKKGQMQNSLFFIFLLATGMGASECGSQTFQNIS